MALQSKKLRIALISSVLLVISLGVVFTGIYSKNSSTSPDALLIEYNSLLDSLTTTEEKIRDEVEPNIISLHKDRLTLFQNRIEKLRLSLADILEPKENEPVHADLSPSDNDIEIINEDLDALAPIETVKPLLDQEPKEDKSTAPIESTTAETPSEVPMLLIYVLVGTAFILLLAISVLLFLIKKNKKKPAAKPVEKKIKFEFAPRNEGIDELDNLELPEPIAVDKENTDLLAGLSNSRNKETQMKELEAFFAQKNANDYSGDFGHTQELEALFPNVAKKEATVDPALKALYPSTLKKMEKEDKEKSDILKLARRGYTSSDIARRLRLSQDQVELFLRMHRDRQ